MFRVSHRTQVLIENSFFFSCVGSIGKTKSSPIQPIVYLCCYLAVRSYFIAIKPRLRIVWILYGNCKQQVNKKARIIKGPFSVYFELFLRYRELLALIQQYQLIENTSQFCLKCRGKRRNGTLTSLQS